MIISQLPELFVQRERALLGPRFDAMFSYPGQGAVRGASVNALRCTPQQFAALADFPLEASPFCASAFVVPQPDWKPGRHPYHHAGAFYAQEPSASAPATLLDVHPGMRVADLCAAPGGKSFAAAFAMENEGSILSCDLHENKLKRIREGAQRLGITCIETAAVDGRAFREEWAGKFDVVICDVPCSGLGIIRKKPDIRYKDVQEFSALPEIQRAILENSARYVKRGGLLVYSTCTILPEENEQVTDDFLKAHDEFTYEAFSLPNGVSAPGHLTLWPQRDNTDGFYLSRMRRKTHD